jgi:hypothetical protein
MDQPDNLEFSEHISENFRQLLSHFRDVDDLRAALTAKGLDYCEYLSAFNNWHRQQESSKPIGGSE